MTKALIDQAIDLLEKANADLQPELLPAPAARSLLASYARARRLVDFGIAGLSRKLDDACEVARVTGTSMGKARTVVSTGKVLAASEELSSALQGGDISLDQAGEIAAAEESCPGAATELVAVAQKEAFHVLKDKARKVKLEAEQHKNLGERQRAARSARSYADELGMVHSTSRWNPTSARRSSTAPRQKPPACIGRPTKRTGRSPSSATSPTPMLRCCLARAGAAPAAPSSSSW